MRSTGLALALAIAASLAGVARAQDASAPEGAPPEEAVPVPPPAEPAPEAAPEGAPLPEAEAAPPAAQPTRRLVVVDVATYGIDPVVGRVATERMRRTGAEMGYHVLDATETVGAAQRLRMPYPPTPADLWRVTWVAQAHRGAFARIWAAEGRYVIEVMVASLDGGGPFFGRETAGAGDLREVIDRVLRQALPPPSQWQEQAAPAAQARPARPRWRERPREELAHPGGIGVRLPEPPIRRWSVTTQTEAVIGTTQGGFYNHLAGVRLDFRITRDLILGVYVAYANLQGRNDRAHNLLVMLQGEQRIRLGSGVDLNIPLRVGLGYLPFNGPVVRLAAGLNYPISADFEIGADIVAPTFWILPDEVAVSLDVSVEATYRFP
jgi:hypothetical protein